MKASHLIDDANQPAGSTGAAHPPLSRPVIIAVSGLPGTGKTFFCRRLAECLPFTVLQSDALRKQLFPGLDYSAAEKIRRRHFSVNTARVIMPAIDKIVKEANR